MQNEECNGVRDDLIALVRTCPLYGEGEVGKQDTRSIRARAMASDLFLPLCDG